MPFCHLPIRYTTPPSDGEVARFDAAAMFTFRADSPPPARHEMMPAGCRHYYFAACTMRKCFMSRRYARRRGVAADAHERQRCLHARCELRKCAEKVR